jgi:ATP-dependent Lon protease
MSDSDSDSDVDDPKSKRKCNGTNERTSKRACTLNKSYKELSTSDDEEETDPEAEEEESTESETKSETTSESSSSEPSSEPTDEEITAEENRQIENVLQNAIITICGGGDMGTQNQRNKKPHKNPNFFDYSPVEQKYYETLDTKAKSYVNEMEQSVVDYNKSDVPIRFKILYSNANNEQKAVAMRKAESLDDKFGSEVQKRKKWIQTFVDIPFQVYRNFGPECLDQIKGPETATFLNNIKTTLDNTLYGNEDAKNQILRIFAQKIVNPNGTGVCIGLHGPPGTGKTVFVKHGICQALNIPFGFIPLGGATDSSYLEGSSYVWEGSYCGYILDILVKAKCMNPILYFDELDKVSETSKGQEIINVLIHLTDPSQNTDFQDKYMQGISLDLSKCIIIFTYNDRHRINPILKDRITEIKIDQYNVDDKVSIAVEHLIPRILQEYNFKETDFVFSKEVLKYIISRTVSEEGVRGFKRNLDRIVSYINLYLLNPKFNVKHLKGNSQVPFIISNAIVDEIIPFNEDRFSAKHSLYT